MLARIEGRRALDDRGPRPEVVQELLGHSSVQLTLDLLASLATPVIEDFDADGITDLTVYRPSGNSWHLQRSTAGFYGPVQLGSNGDEPLLRVR